MRSSVIVLIVILSVGSVVISLGLLTSEEYLNVPEISGQYERLTIYKDELEKINQQNQQILKDLENQIKNSDDVHIDQINQEIAVVQRIIEENKAELEQVITKLSQMESES
ncbi:MAG: hypothetical protein CO032_07840 [Nitrosopumilales archaeon CG_4_9_14_0_2_um_filter_34_16]|nr:MAG: hypothetical protein CO032_07840 [Nitrosopumilales archaeon CG_4_9_14_0_2_um_filter_34_16]